MMKRDLKQFKMVAGEKVENHIYQNKFNQNQQYRHRDINAKRLPKWDLLNCLSERNNINSHLHDASKGLTISRFRPSRKNIGEMPDLHLAESEQNLFKPSLRQVEQGVQIRDCATPQRVRQPPEISDELKILNEMMLLLPHMRTTNPKGRAVNVKHGSQFVNSEELDIINQMHSELPHMRTKTPNGRIPRQPAVHTLSNETDFINQKKYLLPSMQAIPSDIRHTLSNRNISTFTLAWDA